MNPNEKFQLIKELRSRTVTRVLRIEILEKQKTKYDVVAEFSGDFKELADSHLKKIKKENPKKQYKMAKVIRLEMDV